MKNVLFFLVIISIAASAYGQAVTEIFPLQPKRSATVETPSNILRILKQDGKATLTAVYDTSKWRQLVDEAWGEGISTQKKLEYFDHYWDTVNTTYACFIHLKPVNWDSAISSMRSEIAAGVSRGRFAAIMSKLNMMINDGHSGFLDINILLGELYPGFPAVNYYGNYNFGACMTPLADSTVLVYKAEKNHPFGLEAGDIILGYNNRRLGYLANEVIDKEIPAFFSYGSTYYATWHKLMVAVAASWNLYDTIDIKKKNGSIVHFPTNGMVGKNYYCDCYEIIPPEGIKLPPISDVQQRKNQFVSGVIPGTEIGYAGMFDCMEATGDSLFNRVADLVEAKNVKGLIIDIRTNFGGTLRAYAKTMAYLNDRDLVSWFGCADRQRKDDRFAMKLNEEWMSVYDIMKTYDYFDKPIALLIGPNAISAGDMMNITFRQHPKLKTFGKGTASAYGSVTQVELKDGQNTGYFAMMQSGNFYLTGDTITYLSHLDIPPDFPVWLTPEGVAKGRDDVIDAAVNWIQGQTDVFDRTALAPGIEIYPNPAEDYLKINLQGTDGNNITIKDIMGRDVIKTQLSNNGTIDIKGLASGIYIVSTYSHGNIMTGRFVKR